jgi:hypothetical protein
MYLAMGPESNPCEDLMNHLIVKPDRSVDCGSLGSMYAAGSFWTPSVWDYNRDVVNNITGPATPTFLGFYNGKDKPTARFKVNFGVPQDASDALLGLLSAGKRYEDIPKELLVYEESKEQDV